MEIKYFKTKREEVELQVKLGKAKYLVRVLYANDDEPTMDVLQTTATSEIGVEEKEELDIVRAALIEMITLAKEEGLINPN